MALGGHAAGYHVQEGAFAAACWKNDLLTFVKGSIPLKEVLHTLLVYMYMSFVLLPVD